MPEYARPDSDIQTTGWNCSSGSDLFELVNEVTASDTDYVYTNAMAGNTLIVGLGDVTDPQMNTGHIIRFRAKSANASKGPESCECLLYENGTQRATTGAQGLTRDSFNTYTYTLTTTEADSISNYANLRLHFIPDPSSGTNDEIHVSWAELEIPSGLISINTWGCNSTSAVQGLNMGLGVDLVAFFVYQPLKSAISNAIRHVCLVPHFSVSRTGCNIAAWVEKIVLTVNSAMSRSICTCLSLIGNIGVAIKNSITKSYYGGAGTPLEALGAYPINIALRVAMKVVKIIWE